VRPLPRLRGDLIISKQVNPEGVIFVFKDPLQNQFYRFPEEAHFIASQLDGKTELEVVRRRIEEKFGSSLTPEELTAFIGTLTTAGLLDTGKSQVKAAAPFVQGSVLYLRFRAFDPDRLFNYLIGKVQFCFTPTFLVLSALTILSAVCVAYTNWGDVIQNLSRLWQWWALPVILTVVILVVVGHEFGHGLTCKHFGGEVHEFGFMLIYFSPALYVNVSDAWLFPQKSKRLWVGFAGPYFELFLWALATWVWRLTNTDTVINFLAFIVMVTSGIKTLFNFNPVIKLDGYYLLSDWLEIPNLRAKSFGCLSDTIKKLFGAKVSRLEQMVPRERRICLVYGLIAGVGSFWLLSWALVRASGNVLHGASPIAFAISAAFIGGSARDLWRRAFKSRAKLPGPAANPDASNSVSSTVSPAAASRVKDPPAPARSPVAESPDIPGGNVRPSDSQKSPEPIKKNRMKMPIKSKRLPKLLVIGGATAAVLIFVRMDLKIKGSFDVLPVHNADVRAGAEGIIEEIHVTEGQTVQQGELIASLFDRDVRAELQKTEAAIAEGKAKLRLLVAGPRPEEIEQARIEVAKDAEAIAFATSRVERDTKLFGDKLVSKQDLENSEANLALRKSEAATAKSKLEVLLAGSRPEEIEAMKESIASLESQRRYLDEQLKLMRVVSPASGVVATPARQLIAMKHQLVKKGDLVAKVFDLKTITAEMIVSESDIGDVKVDQKVLLKVRAYPEKTFYGKVKSIAIAAQGGPSSTGQSQGAASANNNRNNLSPRMVAVTTEIENGDLLLKPDMSGQGKVFCGKRRLLDIMTRRIARTIRVEFWSWW
jgi:multidrug resistance efflux pump